jgi:hypothetical protein
MEPEETGRHIVVDGVAVEFPVGPLGVGDLILDTVRDTVLVPTTAGEWIRCLRPEASVLDRLTLVAGSSISSAFLQAATIFATQSTHAGWDQDWIDMAANKAGLGKLWNHLKKVLDAKRISGKALHESIQIGWG